MSSEIDSTSRHFLEVSVAHRLLSPENAEPIQTHADENDMQVADAALSLSMMKPWEVEAATLLADPNGFAPGFQLTGLIGSGSAGLVFRAHQTTLGRDVALKTINIMTRGSGSKGESRIQREAQSIARLQHPHIVAAYDSGFHKGRFWISMEFVEGETLANLIEREAPVSEAVVWSIVRQAAAALDHARQIGIIHRDIKPANIFSAIRGGRYDVVKLLDFGLVRQTRLSTSSEEHNEHQTSEGSITGSPLYLSPEQALGEVPDERSDIYSLGAVAYYLTTGRPPFMNDNPMRVIMAHAHDVPTAPREFNRDIPSAFAQVIMKCLEKDPANRFANVRLLQQALVESEASDAWDIDKATNWWNQYGCPEKKKLDAEVLEV